MRAPSRGRDSQPTARRDLPADVKGGATELRGGVMTMDMRMERRVPTPMRSVDDLYISISHYRVSYGWRVQLPLRSICMLSI